MSPPPSTWPRRPAGPTCCWASSAPAVRPSCRSRSPVRASFRGGERTMRILIVEDDLEAAEAMERGLTEAGNVCSKAADGEEGLTAARDGEFDVMIVDRMMPRMNGVQLIETLRREGDQTPVLFLSALGEVGDRVAGLQAGGDDYLVKPYAFAELIARVEALSRRRGTGSGPTPPKGGGLGEGPIGGPRDPPGQGIDPAPGPVAAARDRLGPDPAEGRRAGDGPDRAHRAPPGQGDRPAAARVPAAGIHDAPRGPVGDADHAAGEGLGVPLRPADQRH